MIRILIARIALLTVLTFGTTAQAVEFTDQVFAGYQGWFGTSCDSEYPFWRHWSAGTSPSPGNITFELYPDMREYVAGDVCATGLANLGNGSADTLYASGRTAVINKHFEWMQTAGIDGAAVQRFLVETFQNGSPVANVQAQRDRTFQRVRTAAEATGRYFYLTIDVAHVNASTFVADFQADVLHIEGLSGNPMGSANYAKQGGKPVILIWGCGFADESTCTPSQAQTLITWLKGKGYYVVGGIPHWWNNSTVDPNQPAWKSTYFMFDMLQPWQGAFANDTDTDNYATQAASEKALVEANGVAYQNIMMPGFAWSNWNGGPQNQIPRRGGQMMWRWAYRIKEMGATNAYIAMFDEYDEGTAIAKAATDSSMIPTNQYFLTLNADGIAMSSDFYLRLSGDLTKMIKGTAPLTLTIPTPYFVTTPSTPGSPSLLVASSSQINVSWTASTGSVTNYRVERCQGAACVNFVEVGQPTATTYSDTGLTASTLYRYRVRAWYDSVTASGYSSVVQGTTLASGSGPLMTQSDLVYVGAFRIPGGNFTGTNQTFEYSGGFVSGNVYEDPVNGKTLFIPGLLGAGYVSNVVSIAQVKIPASILNPDTVGMNGLTTATVVQNFDDPSNGKGSLALGGGNGFGTLINYGGKIIGTESVAYDATCNQTHSPWVSSPNFANKASATGPYQFNSAVGPRWLGGAYMAMIPTEWQSALGGKVVSGSGPWSIVSCGSPGPTLHVIDADYLITQPSTTPLVPTIPLVYYVENDTQATLGHWNSNDPNQIINGVQVPNITVTDPFGRGTFTIPYEDNAMRVSGVLFPEGKRSVLFFGFKGMGPYCYGEGTNDPKLHGQPLCEAGGTCCYDPDGVGGKGDHSYPYTSFVWAYDVNDLIAAKNGTKNPWNVYPYTGWAFKLPLATQPGKPVGVSWDPATRLAYMVMCCVDYNGLPLVHVFSVPSSAPAVPSSLTIARRVQ